MNYFETIKAALDALVNGICQHRSLTREQAMEIARAHLQTMSTEWFSGQTPNIAYGDPLCRFGYLYCHTGVNANLCERCMRSSEPVVEVINQRLEDPGELRVCAFGGGPGTELLAISKYLCSDRPSGPQGDLNFTLLDIVPEWAESWNALERAIKVDLRSSFGHRNSWPFTISKTFQPFDMTQVEQYANLSQLFCHDLYVMNYIISEVFSNSEALARLVSRMSEAAESGSIFLIIDRDEERVVKWGRQLLAQAGLHEVDFGNTKDNMDSDERIATLKDYKDAIGYSPRLTWRGAFWLVGQKP